MANGTLQEIMQQLAAMTFDEKLMLTAFLIEQLRRDREVAPVETENGRELAPDGQLLEQSNEPDPHRRLEYAWLKEHRAEYAGQYVALFNNRLIAHGANGRKVLAEARLAGFPRSLMVRIESSDEPPFGGW